MNCKCGKKAVYENLCSKHFIEYYENKVWKTIEQYSLIKPNDKVCVAISGGKDSLTLMYILTKKYDVTGLAIDEGIPGYREKTLSELKKTFKKVKILSFKKEFGFTLTQYIKGKKIIPCTPCGILRRKLLNNGAEGFDVLTTGHNLDDETQTVLMNLFKGSMKLNARIGPKSGVKKQKGFVQRVKPLYFCSEKETAAYAYLNGLIKKYHECPNARFSFRAHIRNSLNELENKQKGSKINLINNFLSMKKEITDEIGQCESCKQPSQLKICGACKICQLT